MRFSIRRMKKLIYTLFILGISVAAKAQNTYQQRVQKYIEQYKDIAIEEMKRTGVPASITLAQGIIETNAGTSPLATGGNNHFGIKCHNEWSGDVMYYDDDKRDECFRKYENAELSFKDHSDFLKTRSRYSILFNLSVTDYKSWAKGLKSCGYATNPRYSDMLINTIEANNLQQYDSMGLDENWVKTGSGDSTQQIIVQQNQDPDIDAVVVDINADPKEGSVFYLNNIKTVELKKGESLKSIAKKYGISTKRLLRYNDLTEKSVVKAGDKIYLQPKRRNGNEGYHTVAAGETMYLISQQHGIQLSYLYQKNKMKPGTQPAAGQIIYLRSERSSAPLLNTGSVTVKSVPPSSGEVINDRENKYYTVQKGDTLYSISKKYNLTVDELKNRNKLNSDSLSVGDVLLVQ